MGWRFGANLGPSLQYVLTRTGPRKESVHRVVSELNANGIAQASIDELETTVGFCDLEKAADELVNGRSSEISKLKEAANINESIGSKTFNLEMLGSEVTFDPECIFSRLALSRSFIEIANRYFRMQTRLRYFNVWYTAASSSSARESQLWHFDREDRMILKVFVYLRDVDHGSGPFTYAPGTHKKGEHSGLSPAFFDESGVRRTTDEQMSAVFPKKNWRVCSGVKGSVIFADTRGFHKGGEARTGDRLMFTCMYTSPASESRTLMRHPENMVSRSMTRTQRAALGIT